MVLYSQCKTSGNFQNSEDGKQQSCKHTLKSLKVPAGGSNWQSFQRSVLFLWERYSTKLQRCTRFNSVGGRLEDKSVGSYAANLAP